MMHVQMLTSSGRWFSDRNMPHVPRVGEFIVLVGYDSAIFTRNEEDAENLKMVEVKAICHVITDGVERVKVICAAPEFVWPFFKGE